MGDEVGGDPEDDEEQEGREGEQQDQRAGDGEDTATEEVAKRQEDASGDEQETGETEAESGAIWTDFERPSSSGPITVAPPRDWTSWVEIAAEWMAGMISTLAGPVRRMNG